MLHINGHLHITQQHQYIHTVPAYSYTMAVTWLITHHLKLTNEKRNNCLVASSNYLFKFIYSLKILQCKQQCAKRKFYVRILHLKNYYTDGILAQDASTQTYHLQEISLWHDLVFALEQTSPLHSVEERKELCEAQSLVISDPINTYTYNLQGMHGTSRICQLNLLSYSNTIFNVRYPRKCAIFTGPITYELTLETKELNQHHYKMCTCTRKKETR